MEKIKLKKNFLPDDNIVMVERIAELENQILESTPSDNWSIGEKSISISSMPSRHVNNIV